MLQERRAEYLQTMEGFLSDKHFSFDIDGITQNTAIPVCMAYNERYHWDPPYTPADIGAWDALRDHALAHGVPETEAIEINSKLWFDPHILNQGPPVSWAPPLVAKLQRYCKVPPQFISSRLPIMVPYTAFWFRHSMPPEIDPSQIHIRKDVNIKGIEFKIDKINALGITHHVEDVPSQAEDIVKYTGAHVVCLPFGQTPCDLEHPRLTVIRSTAKTNYQQSLMKLYQMVAHGAIPAGSF